MMTRYAAVLLLAMIAVSVVTRTHEAEAASDGFFALEETSYGWRVYCQVADGQSHCTLSAVRENGDGERYAVELRPEQDGGLEGSLVLPLGLLLNTGVMLQLDGNRPLKTFRFRVCAGDIKQYNEDLKGGRQEPGSLHHGVEINVSSLVSSGCIVPFEIDAETVRAMRGSEKLWILARDGATEERTPFSVSLKGFVATHNKATEFIADHR